MVEATSIFFPAVVSVLAGTDPMPPSICMATAIAQPLKCKICLRSMLSDVNQAIMAAKRAMMLAMTLKRKASDPMP